MLVYVRRCSNREQSVFSHFYQFCATSAPHQDIDEFRATCTNLISDDSDQYYAKVIDRGNTGRIHMTIDTLDRNTEYGIQISVHTQDGSWSDWTLPLMDTTKDEKSDWFMSEAVRTESVSHSEILISLALPPPPYDDIDKIRAKCSNLISGTTIEDINMHQETTGRIHVTIHSLEPDTEYSIQVSAHTRDGNWSKWTHPHVDKTKTANLELALPSLSVSEIAPLLPTDPSNQPSSSQQPDYDIGLFVDEKCPDATKRYIISTRWTAPPGFAWPFNNKQYGQKTYKRHLSQTHINTYPNFAYSVSKNGLFCKTCVLARPTETAKRPLGKLVTQPLQRYDKLTGTKDNDLLDHLKLQYHNFGTTQCDSFIKNFDTNTNIRSKIDAHHLQVCKANRKCLEPVVKTILFCGQNNAPLQGNNDSGLLSYDGNKQGEGLFRRLLKFRVDAGDVDLQQHFTAAAKNATYISPHIQNEIIICIGDQIRDRILTRVKSARYYAILADETTDISTIEQMSLCLRYFDADLGDIREDFLCFEDLIEQHYGDNTATEPDHIPKTMDEYLQLQAELNQESYNIVEPRMSGAVIADSIINKLVEYGLALNRAVAQGYDGAAVMSSENVGTSANIKKTMPSCGLLPLLTTCSKSGHYTRFKNSTDS